jgi:hypothetical protein
VIGFEIQLIRRVDELRLEPAWALKV